MSKNEDKKKSFVMYDSFLEAMKHLNDAEFRECVMKIRDYALEGIDKESVSPYVNIIIAMAKPNLDAAKRRYEVSVENGKKGAEFGKLGGAPKGNQNARKNNPQSTPKQPLDVDVNDDVEEDVNENEEVNVEVDADAPSGSTTFQSSFSNSSNSSLTYEANESERLEEREENKEKEPMQEVYNFKGLESATASEEEEIHINFNSESNNTPPVSPCSEKEPECSAARPQQQKDSGMDMSKYLEECIIKNATRLACLRKIALPQDDNLFWRTVGLYCDLYGDSKKDAARFLNKFISEQIRKGIV